MIAAQNERAARPFDHRPHPTAVRLDACRPRVVETAAVHRSPKICVELEICDAPVTPHCAKNSFKVPLRIRMRPVHGVPAAFFLYRTPPAERDLVRAQGFAVGALHEPI